MLIQVNSIYRELINILLIIISLLFSIYSSYSYSDTRAEKPFVQLSKVYKGEDPSQYLLSEKYDGVRAIWRHQQLRSRTGKLIHAPIWFTQKLPNVWLDGELWFERNSFEYVASTVSKNEPNEAEWRNITYMVFDAPNLQQPFRERAAYYTELIQALNIPHIKAVEQITLNKQSNLQTLLDSYTKQGAEGLMLHKAGAPFTTGRSAHVLKVKPYMDAEAKVIKHISGSGKYSDMMGAILVEFIANNQTTIHFKIGTGFSDYERANPPCIGCVITFKYHGFTKRGVPRFASFLRMHQ